MIGLRTDGYFLGADYTYGYYRELSPVFQRFCLLMRGIACDDPGETAAHCELGFGQGVSLAIHAAANPGQYVATDFNSAHATHARGLASQSACRARIYDDSFAQLLARDDLPAFDSISLHGVWSWIAEDNHRVITEFVSRHLKPGGSFYVSYNCLPGWSPAHPLRHLFAQYDRYAAASSGAEARVGAALQFASSVLAAGPVYARAVPGASEKLEVIKTQPKNYIAHEYLNRSWHCLYFSEMVDALSEAKLEFATTAQPLEVLDSTSLTADGVACLNGIDHPMLREQVRDYFVNRQFRMDLFQRGVRRLAPVEQRALVLEARVVLERPATAIPMTVNGAQGEVTLLEAIFRPVVDALAAEDYAPKSFRDLLTALPNISLPQIVTACAVLVGAGHASPCHSASTVRQVRSNCAALNRHLLERARISGDINTLASPLTGGGVAVDRLQQLFLLARGTGLPTPADWAQFAWGHLSDQGHSILKDGRSLTTAEENLSELVTRARAFASERLPILLAQEVV